MAENKQSILTESGTNEFEMLSFYIDDCAYGINVSKVREIIKAIHITPVPGSDNRRLGIIIPREELISVIDLRYCLSGVQTDVDKCEYFIICHFNNLTTAFPVDNVKDIRRFGWNEIIEPSAIVNSEQSTITGLIKTETEIVSILDFESIVAGIDVSNSLTVKDIANLSEKEINNTIQRDLHVVVAEDSKMLNKLITENITKAGYSVVSFYNGEDALKYTVENVNKVDIVISDIEMPQRDGLSFLKTIKENEKTKYLPFIVFSSLIDEAMKKKCKSLGADDTITKPELGKLIDLMHELTDKQNKRQEISMGY